MPSYLNNCTVTQYGPVLENEGDSPLTQTLETQLPPSFIQNGVEVLASQFNTTMHAHYWLVVSANPGYHIHTGMITIAGQTADSSDFTNIGVNATTGEEMLTPNGMHFWGLNPDTNIPNNVNVIMTVDSKLDKWNECDNQVIVLVNIEEGFSMPSYNVQFLIDLDGSADYCYTGIEDNTNLNWQMRTQLHITGDFSGNLLAGAVYIARYFDDTSTSPNNFARWLTNGYNDWAGYSVYYDDAPQFSYDVAPKLCYPEAEGPVTNWGYQGDGDDPCIGQLQPTCYRKPYHNRWTNYGYLDEPTEEAPYTIGTVQGRIISTSGNTSTVTNFTSDLSGYGFQEFGMVRMCWMRSLYKYKATPPNSGGSEYVDLTEYPTFTPGGPHIPSAEIFYLKYFGTTAYGANPLNKRLIADPQFIDIWAATTIVRATNGQRYSWSGGTWSDGPSGWVGGEVDDNYLVYEYTAENNQCDIDLSNVVLEQIDDQTVKITIPYNVNTYDGWARSTISEPLGYGGQTRFSDARRNEIFVNVYPVEI